MEFHSHATHARSHTHRECHIRRSGPHVTLASQKRIFRFFVVVVVRFTDDIQNLFERSRMDVLPLWGTHVAEFVRMFYANMAVTVRALRALQVEG